jgi:PTS system mannose-specific IID component
LFYAIPTFIIVYWGQYGIDLVLAWIPESLIVALSVVGGILPAVGIGLLLRGLGQWRRVPYFVIGFLLVIYFELPVLVVALLGLAVAWLSVGELSKAATIVGTDSTLEQSHSVPPRVRRASWWRWVMFLHASYNYERLQGLGFAHTMVPVIKHLYHTSQERAAALKRHLLFFNTEPQIGALVPAVIITMEEQRASGADIPDHVINGLKSGLMGPLAGVGDSLFQGLIVPVLLAMGIGLAQRGTLAGPLLYSLLISVLVLGTSYVFWSFGYRLGKVAVSRILASGWLQIVTEGASIVGMFTVGGLASKVVQFTTPASIRVGQAVVSLQSDVFDAILRGLLPLALVVGTWWLLNRGFSPLRVIGLVFAAGIDLAYLGLAGGSSPPLLTAEWITFVVGGERVTIGLVLAHLWPPLLATAVAAIMLLTRRDIERKR